MISKNKNLKVLVVLPGGLHPPNCEVTGQKAIYNLQKKLAQNTELHTVNLVCKDKIEELKPWFEEQTKKYKIHFHIVPAKTSSSIISRYLRPLINQLRVLLLTIKLLKKIEFDILHEYTSAPLTFRKASIYKIIRKKLTVFFTLWVYNAHKIAAPKLGGKAKNVDKIICPSKFILSLLSKSKYKISKLSLIPFGVNIKEFAHQLKDKSLKDKFNIDQNSKIILYIGLLDKRKGADVFLQSIPKVLKKFKNVVFIFASSPIHKGVLYKHDDAKIEFKNWIEASGKNLIFLEGKQNIPNLMSIADIFVYPISTMHGILSLPLTLLEAIASSKAIITTKIPPMNDIFDHNKTAILIKPHSTEECSQAIVNLLKNSNLKINLEQKVSRLTNTFDIDHCSQKLLEEYHKTCR